MKKIALSVKMSELLYSPYGENLRRKLMPMVKPYLTGGPSSISLKHIDSICGHMDALHALAYCGEDGKKVYRLIATDMANEVVNAFEREYAEEQRAQKALVLVRAFAEGKAGDEALEQARVIAKELEASYSENTQSEMAEFGIQVAEIVGSAAAVDAKDAMYDTLQHYIGDEEALCYPGAFEAINAMVGKLLNTYVADMGES